MKEINDELLDKYFDVTRRALEMVKDNPWDEKRKEIADDYYRMAKDYFSDAGFFREKGDYVRSFGALNYAHAWLDAGARIGLFKVNDNQLFTVD